MSFPGTGKIWMNGKLVDWADAKIHVASHVVHYGSAVFEGARCYETLQGPACFRLDAHMRRLLTPRGSTGWRSPTINRRWQMRRWSLIRQNEFKACYIRPIVYEDTTRLASTRLPCPIDVAIMLWEWGAYFTKEAIEEGLTSRFRPGRAMLRTRRRPWQKVSANYANAQLIKMEAIADGYAEGIALNTQGNLSEGSGQNMFVVREGIIYTPPIGNSVLWGITRDSVMTIARELGFEVREQKPAPRNPLYRGRGVFRGHGRGGDSDPVS